QPSVSVGRVGFVLLNVHCASNRVGAEGFGCTRIDEDSREVAIEDVSKAVQIGLHRVAQGAPYRQAELIAQNAGESIIIVQRFCHSLALAARGSVAGKDQRCVNWISSGDLSIFMLHVDGITGRVWSYF